MPKIIKTNAQEQALQTIINNLKVTERINAVLENVEILECATTTFAAEKEKVTLDLPEAVVSKILGDIRKAKVSEIKTLSKKYAITLDEDDNKILEAATPKKAPAPKKETAPIEIPDEEKAENEAEEAEVTEIPDAEESEETAEPQNPYAGFGR